MSKQRPQLIFAFLLIFMTITASAQVQLIPPDVPERSPAKIYLPKNYGDHGDWPVILLLHGYEENQAFISRYFFGSDDKILSDTRFILVVPEGLPEISPKKYHYWNASAACCDFKASHVDDTKYLTDLVDQVAAKYKVDRKRISAAGHSNGAFMAHRLACASSDRFAAVVAFAGMTSLSVADCSPTTPVSLLQINAQDDETIKFTGDAGFPPLAPYPGANESAMRWVTLDHCNPTPIPQANTSLTDNFRFGGVDATSRAWSGCAGGSEVRQEVIQPYSAPLYHAHAPLLSWEFTNTIVSFMLAHSK